MATKENGLPTTQATYEAQSIPSEIITQVTEKIQEIQKRKTLEEVMIEGGHHNLFSAVTEEDNKVWVTFYEGIESWSRSWSKHSTLGLYLNLEGPANSYIRTEIPENSPISIIREAENSLPMDHILIPLSPLMD